MSIPSRTLSSSSNIGGKSSASIGISEHMDFSHNAYIDMMLSKVDFPLPFFPIITFTPGLKINSLPFSNASISETYSNGVFVLSFIFTDVIIVILFKNQLPPEPCLRCACCRCP